MRGPFSHRNAPVRPRHAVLPVDDAQARLGFVAQQRLHDGAALRVEMLERLVQYDRVRVLQYSALFSTARARATRFNSPPDSSPAP